MSPSGEPVDIGRQTQLFIDDRLVETADGVELRLNRPELQKESLLSAEHPWEAGRVMSSGSMVYHDGTFKLWYDAREWVDDAGYQAGGGPADTRRLCYAESDDGVHFEKPDLGVVEYDGSRENNIVTVGCTGQVFLDPGDDPDRRFKAVMVMRPEKKELGWGPAEDVEPREVYLFHSPDGVHWSRSEEVVFPLFLGATQSVVWDDRLETWVLYLRGHSQGEYEEFRPNRFCRVEVPPGELDEPYPFDPLPDKEYDSPTEEDLTEELPVVLERDAADPQGIEAQPYLMNAWKYPGAERAYLAFPPMWYPRSTSMIEPQLAVSRDGVDWERPWRRAVIPAGSGLWETGGQVWPVMDPVVRNDEVWLYYLTMPEEHFGRQDADTTLARAVWGRDRFVAADSGPSEGTLTTPPLRFDGDELVVNFNAGAWGHLTVGVKDRQGRFVAGYSMREAVPLSGNELSAEAVWERGENDSHGVGSLAGTPVKLQFDMVNCELYSFQVT
jgi:hypothetical protein